MQKPIHSAAIFVCAEKDPGLAVTREMLSVLSGCPLLLNLDVSYKANLNDFRGEQFRYVSDEALLTCTSDDDSLKAVDCAIVLGGDGSIIRAASRCAPSHIPVLGINLGRVGYLADVERDELWLLSRLCTGDYRTERRMMLSVSVWREGRCIHETAPALNDAVISNGAISHMVELAMALGGEPLYRLHADGVIAATPTGSTAYSMSAGGPVIDPGLSCICVTPVCSHSLNERPMLLSPQSELSVTNVCTREDNTFLTVDGAENFKLLYGDTVKIRRAAAETEMIRFHGNSFYSLLSRKMGSKE